MQEHLSFFSLANIVRSFKALFKRGFTKNVKVFYDVYWFDFVNRTDTSLVKLEKLFKESIYDQLIVNSATDYVPTKTSVIVDVLKQLKIIDKKLLKNIFVDFGSGKGRVLILAEKYGFKKIIGVEYSKELCSDCIKNLKIVKSNNVEVTNCDAREFSIKKNMKVFYFFNPFNDLIMKDILNNILSVEEKERYIVYVNPVFRVLLENNKNFELVYEKKDYKITIWKIL